MPVDPSADHDPTAALARLAGILPAYHDIWGNPHPTSQKTCQSLLAAIGLAAGDAAQAATTLRAYGEEAWGRRLPQVQVEFVGEPIRITLRLPEHRLGKSLRWRLDLESGGHLEGEIQPTNLQRLERRELGGHAHLALALPLPPIGETGYHRLGCAAADEEMSAGTQLIVCPRSCHLPEAAAGAGRLWGLSVQLHSQRSAANWGIGDYADLRAILDWAAGAGAGLVGVNPLHALFPHNPAHCSPYSPSSRQFLNTLLLSVETIPEFSACAEALTRVASPEFAARLAALRAAPLIDYVGVAEAKTEILELVYRHFRSRHLDAGTARGEAFTAFCAAEGEDLRRFALYHALQEHFHHRDPTCWGWPLWPEPYRSPTAEAVRRFATEHRERVEWYMWLQWLADSQLGEAAGHAKRLGMAVGLYQDLAVGVERGGAETWARQDIYALDAAVGCPPDDFNLLGQDWGLPPWIPQRLTATAYAPFIAVLRANMRHAGALRIDHVMGLLRLYWIPPGMRGDEGAYLAYPFRDLLGILALESRRNRCLIVGEDLGTVPDELRSALREAGVLTYRLFYFERQSDGNLIPPSWYPEQALVAATTHDLPTLTGFWQGRDIEVRSELELYPNEAARDAQRTARHTERAHLLAALARERLLPAEIPLDPERVPRLTPDLLTGVQRYLARTPAKLMLVQAEDILGEVEQANMPGTVDGHPNWQRKLSLAVEDWPDDPRMRVMAESLRNERPAIG